MTDAEHTLPIVLPLRSRSALRGQIENLSISADAKAILNDVIDLTTVVGGQVVQFGRRIIDFILNMVKQFPNTTFGLIVGVVLTSLVTSIPFIGPLLGPLLGPLFIALGIMKGAIVDLNNAALSHRVATLEAEFRAIDVRT